MFKRLLKADALILGGLAIYAVYSGINQAGSNSNRIRLQS